MEKEKFDAIMQDIEMEVQARLNEKEKTEKNIIHYMKETIKMQ